MGASSSNEIELKEPDTGIIAGVCEPSDMFNENTTQMNDDKMRSVRHTSYHADGNARALLGSAKQRGEKLEMHAHLPTGVCF